MKRWDSMLLSVYSTVGSSKLWFHWPMLFVFIALKHTMCIGITDSVPVKCCGRKKKKTSHWPITLSFPTWSPFTISDNVTARCHNTRAPSLTLCGWAVVIVKNYCVSRLCPQTTRPRALRTSLNDYLRGPPHSEIEAEILFLDPIVLEAQKMFLIYLLAVFFFRQ